MRIKFKSPDPRDGSIAQMDSSRGQQLIDSGSAVRVSDNESETGIVESVPVKKAPEPQNKMAKSPENKSVKK